jgi:hypothetical protein
MPGFFWRAGRLSRFLAKYESERDDTVTFVD